jgi:type IV pilus assembly protein PilQ
MKFHRICVLATALLLSASVAIAADKAPDAADALRDSKAKVTLDVQDVPLDSALRILAKQFKLSIITAKSVDSTVSAQFTNVTLKQALDSLVTINGFAYRAKGGVIEVFSPAKSAGAAGLQPEVETYVLRYANAAKLKELIKSFLSKTGKVEADIGSNTLIVYDEDRVIQAVSKIIEKVDLPDPQVTISAEIVEASIEIGEKLGINWQTRLAASGSKRPITFPFGKNDHSVFFPKNSAGAAEDAAEFSPNSTFPYAKAEDFTFGTLDATGLQAVLEVIRSDDSTNLIANPEITTLNNREAKISIGNTVPVPIYTTNLETGVSAVTGFEDVETGTLLSVTPQVNAGGESVTMLVKPEISEILGFKGQFDERPLVASRKAETTVRLKDGETLVIGGLVSEKVEENITKVPLLGDIPLLGWLFKSKSLAKTKSSLYIFVTPRVLKDEGYTYSSRAKLAAERLARNAMHRADSSSNDLRKPGAVSPYPPEPKDD